MRRLLPVILVILVALMIERSSLPPRLGPRGGTIAIAATPVQLDPRNPAVRRVGELTYLRGWQLTSPSPEFGGLSALRPWRRRWLAVEDTGALISFSPTENQALLMPLSPRCQPNRVRLGRDLEGLDTDGRSIWVSAEWHNTICRRDADGAQWGIRPAAMADWPRSSGPETLLRLRDGRFLIFPEDAAFPALLFPGDPVSGAKPATLRYSPPAGYSPTDAAELPDGRLVVLNRRFGLHGFEAKLVLFDGLPAHGAQQGRTIATLARPLIHDNFEGIAARREGRATVLTIVSDDNKNGFQQTLLLEFRLGD
ncbi:MAG TPA: esterase-like activity of phytase family protein [Sphingomonas sp.]|nr:esterase-like activity of phytase family protein [Sphingomonas sp.]